MVDIVQDYEGDYVDRVPGPTHTHLDYVVDGDGQTRILDGQKRPAAARRGSWACCGSWAACLTMMAIGLVGGYLLWIYEAAHRGPLSCAEATTTLVQSIPVGDFKIGPVAGALATHDALLALADGADVSLDLTAMYMDLLGEADRQLYSPSQMSSFGADSGAAVFAALKRAAARKVRAHVPLGTAQNLAEQRPNY